MSVSAEAVSIDGVTGASTYHDDSSRLTVGLLRSGFTTDKRGRDPQIPQCFLRLEPGNAQQCSKS